MRQIPETIYFLVWESVYMAPATIIHKSKIYLKHSYLDKEAVIELKIWEIAKGIRFPEGIKYSLFCVEEGKVLVGFDNHHPKGHHLHIQDNEYVYNFNSYENLLEDFYAEIAKFGYYL
jgi:hypothetical protein